MLLTSRMFSKELSPVLSSRFVLKSSSQTFAPNISPQNTLIKVISDLLFAQFNGQFLVLILLDLVVAYKIVDHSLLFEILCSLSFQNTTSSGFPPTLTTTLLSPLQIPSLNCPRHSPWISLFFKLIPFVTSSSLMALAKPLWTPDSYNPALLLKCLKSQSQFNAGFRSRTELLIFLRQIFSSLPHFSKW